MNLQHDLSTSRIRRDGLSPGEMAPEFELPSVSGAPVSLSHLRGRRVLLVFSDPECGPCDSLAPRLEHLSRRTPDIDVVMISRRTPEANASKIREHQLTFPVLMQREREVSMRYAQFATPVAYLIDERGLIAAPAAVGVEPVLTLLRAAAIRALLES